MAKRSPILGYNHNIRHRGVVFHVQTEDSGIKNPHLFTHLFHGGVIISSRKLVYDAEADEEVVKSLMQAQHKAMLKDLKTGKFTAKIDEYLVGNPDLVPSSAESDLDQRTSTEPFQRVDLEEIAAAGLATAPTLHMPEPPSEVSAAFLQAADADPTQTVPTATSGVTDAAIPVTTPIAATEAMKVPGRARVPLPIPTPPIPTPSKPSDSAQQPVPGPPPVPARRAHSAPARRAEPPPRQAIAPARAAERSQPQQLTQPHGQRSSRSNVVVSRPAVIVGAPSRVVGGSSRGNSASSPSASHPTDEAHRAHRARTPAASLRPAAKVRNSKDSGADSLFGQGLISEKSLDEVILAYLSEDGAED